mmetsp:Transcript_17398/g.26409  ORF Transcript_17398/g.26409 Transcript_17398/m.26409 type:complete len:704 (+) Transcript_17398:256-2367(+)
MISSGSASFLNSRQARRGFEEYNSLSLKFLAIACLLATDIPIALAQYDGCSVCGKDSQVGKPDAIFAFPQQPAVSCQILEDAGKAGLIPSDQCSYLPELIVSDCGCQKTNPNSETSSPSSRPTFDPTAKPTMPPSPEPTEEPTSPPTDAPTTMRPSLTPLVETEAPSIYPTSLPSSYPTSTPTPEPSETPTFVPTSRDSAEPSVTPTIATSAAPSSGPTLLSSQTPSHQPTALPSNAPTSLPSQTPTSTLLPSSSPSSTPTISPTVSPSNNPTAVPSFSPTNVPSGTPTQNPTFPLQSTLIELAMFFEGIDEEIPRGDQFSYDDITGNHILKEFESIADDYSFDDLYVRTDFVKQTLIIPVLEDAPTEAPIQSRTLQEQPVLKVVSETVVKFRSPDVNPNVRIMIAGAFNEKEERSLYLGELKALPGGAFANVINLKVEVDGEEVPEQIVAQPEQSDSPVINIAPIIGGVAGGIAVVIGAFLIFRRRGCRCRRRWAKGDVTFATTKEGRSGERINTDILVEPQDEISTLGDPMYTAGGMMMVPGLEKDETVANSHISGDYEYSRNYQARQRVDTLQSSLGESKQDSDISSFAAFGKDDVFDDDDISFEQQFSAMEYRFEVVAPAGKLGMVIDTPSGGMPVVHAIKDTSILADKVMVGDRLISVDDEDTTGFTAMQVSKLISQKAHQKTRTLMFSRLTVRKDRA